MLKVARSTVLALGVLLVGALMAPSIASAQMREFTGKVDNITDSRILVDNRMGDKLIFSKVGETVVEGEKDSWEAISKNDWVTVSWKFIDRPRKAYKVVVNPPKEEAGEDEE